MRHALAVAALVILAIVLAAALCFDAVSQGRVSCAGVYGEAADATVNLYLMAPSAERGFYDRQYAAYRDAASLAERNPGAYAATLCSTRSLANVTAISNEYHARLARLRAQQQADAIARIEREVADATKAAQQQKEAGR